MGCGKCFLFCLKKLSTNKQQKTKQKIRIKSQKNAFFNFVFKKNKTKKYIIFCCFKVFKKKFYVFFSKKNSRPKKRKWQDVHEFIIFSVTEIIGVNDVLVINESVGTKESIGVLNSLKPLTTMENGSLDFNQSKQQQTCWRQ